MSWALETQGLGFFSLPSYQSFLPSSSSSLFSSYPSHVLLLSHSLPWMPWLLPDSSSGLCPACPMGSSVNAASLKKQGRAWGWSPPLIWALLTLQFTAPNPADLRHSSIAHIALSTSVWSLCIYCPCDGIRFLQARTLMKCKHEEK